MKVPLNGAGGPLLVSLLLCLPSVLVTAQEKRQTDSPGVIERAEEREPTEDREIAGPIKDVHDAVEVLKELQEDADLRRMLDEAEAVFLIPDYATAALIIGAAGGEGVLLTKAEGEWARPAFYDVGSLSAGVQAGVAAGSIAMVLMSEQAIAAFEADNNFSLTADAGYSIVDWSARARGEVGRGNDIVVWTDTEGLFAELSIGINNVSWDDEENERYYGQQTSPEAILSGEIRNPHQQLLQQALRE